ncbi:MAG: TVP38/TMEM64 family protein [Sphingorhabdus sp.]|uniref:TVP38/TMEM64 family protein n=1 Tax=Sphingorhabdus sp. TaxID=1902408 RepID=UPI003C8902C3
MNKRIALLALLAAAIAAYFWFDLGQYLSLDAFKAQQAQIIAAKDANPLLYIGGFFLIYVIVTALSLPGAAIMSLVAGALFGVVTGSIIVSFASSIGATLAFLSARFLLRDWVQSKFGERLKAIDDGIARDGAMYLFTIRLIPLFPFFVVNLLMGLTRIKTRTFYWVSQIGMLPATVVFVNAGTQISKIDSPAGLLSPTLLGSFVLLGIFPWIARGLVAAVKKVNAR